MPRRTFLATTGSGVARAHEDADGVWQVATVIGGGEVRCLSVDGLSPHRVYAGTHGGGVLRSDDGGTTWRQSGLGGQIVKAIAASPTQPGVVYAGTRPARLYVSRDAGVTWRELAGFRRIPWRWLWFSPAEQPFIGYVQAIALSPTDPNRLVVGIEFGATVLSEDGGRTWTRHRPGSLRDCHGLAFHPTSGDWVYEAGGTGAGASFSRDGGRTWTQPREGLDRHYGWAVAADPADPEVWYVSVAPGPFEAHGEGKAQARILRRDGGTWRPLAGGLHEPLSHMPYALIAEPATPGCLYAGLSNGDVWHSEDRGESWRRLPVNLGAIRQSLVLL
jgi:photosystem II stability/assembly factor-like uncharacterized protein